MGCAGGVGGGQSPRVLMQAAVGRGLKYVSVWVCVHTGWLLRGKEVTR